MTKDFEEMVSRLAKARNFTGGAYCLITALHDEDDVITEINGAVEFILPGLKLAIETILEKSDDSRARSAREYIKNVLIEDEQRRFQASLTTSAQE